MPPPPAFGKAFNASVSNGSAQRLPESRATGSASAGMNHPKLPPRPPSALSRGPNAELVSVEPRISHNISDPGPPAEAEIDPDESFGFLSDDDAFLAAVDLGEGDLGRPIDPDEGLGGPALSANSVQSESEILDTNRHVSGQAQHVRFQEASHQERGALPGATRPSARIESGVGQRATIGAEQSRAAMPSSTTGSSANSHQPRSGTPSMGGFHFPAGVNPTQENPQLPARNGQRLTLGSGILGLNKDQPPQRRMTAGMGLGNQNQRLNPPGGDGSAKPSFQLPVDRRQSNINIMQRGVKREILGNLDIGAEGDVKRPRH
ncbi:hypothetical protein BDN71DRAFT_1038484 [Pleurotus eryngii]|uniref:Uncharacterized protein n=1 Tax=Pleurotus eryngii TaxID=5323 RepID=A0A9P6A6W1_PLEER|nr:hypothetical protein BDN71DRAFT_1038484 [Pleurotus eryngii]